MSDILIILVLVACVTYIGSAFKSEPDNKRFVQLCIRAGGEPVPGNDRLCLRPDALINIESE